jgi:predicted aspartyl protease
MIEDSLLFAARLALALVVTTIIGIVDAGASSCKLNKIAEFPVRLDRSRLIIDGAINDHKIGIQLDTGAERSTILRAAADRLGLTRQPVRGTRMFGIGGETYVESAYIESFKIGETERKGWRPLVVGERDFGANVALLLGEDFFHQIDVEFDLANNAIRLFQPQNCDGVSLAYWTREDVSEVSIQSISDAHPQILLTVQINGKPMQALLDSGAAMSVVDKLDAARIGVTPDTPGVFRMGSGGGLGSRSVEYWSGPIQSFAIGNETIRDTSIVFADLWNGPKLTDRATLHANVPLNPSMLLGADFLRAHRVLVAHSQRKVYFTFTGGSVFWRGEPVQPPGQEQAAAKGDANPAVALTASGNGWRSKGDPDRAIADYDAAIRADPRYAVAYANRGLAKRDKGDDVGGIADLSRAIEINPKFAPAYVARGSAKLRAGNAEAAIVDYAQAIEINPKLATAYNSLAWALATAAQPAFRDGRRAVEMALKACELSEWKNPTYLDTLAASYARAGNFSDAVKWQHKALENPRPGDVEAFAQRLRLYDEGKPWPPD